ncbi:MAG: hypothetical protein ACR2QV_08830, partial [Gammaproteobacteria bacterium]
MSVKKVPKTLVEVTRIGLLAVVVMIGLISIVGKGSSSSAPTPTPPTPTPPQVTVASIALDPATAPGPVPANVDFQIKATGTLSDGKPLDLTASAVWASSDSATVSVSTTGVVRGLKAGGPIDITATSGGISSPPLRVTVTEDPNYTLTKLTIAPFSPAVLPIGETRTHNARATFSDGTNTQELDVSEDVDWFSDNEAVVTVDKGVATGRGKGSTEIFAAFKSPVIPSNKLPIVADFTSAQASLQVVPVPAPGEELVAGFTYQASAIRKDGDGSQVDVTKTSAWSSSDASVLTVSNADGSRGIVTATGPGKATVSANFGVITGRQEYTVTDIAVNAVRVQVRSPLPVGLTADVKVLVEFVGAPGEWIDVTEFVFLTADDPDIASVSNTGVTKSTVTAIKAGQARIQARLAEEEAPFGGVTINVEDGPLQTITLSPPSPARLPEGVKQKFTANGTFMLPSGTTSFDVTRQVTFKSSLPAVAEISNAAENKGEVYGKSVGTTDITAEFATVKSTAVPQEVVAATLASLAIMPANPTVALKAGAVQLRAEGTYTNGDVRDRTETVTWISGNMAVAGFRAVPISKGLLIVQATSSSPVQIQAVASGETNGVAQTLLTVTDPAATGVSINASATTIKQGETLPLLTATGTFSDMS